METTRRVLLLTTAFCLAACVNIDPDTGKTIPRGNQFHEFEEVQRLAKRLKKGMSKPQVLRLLGSPAEKSRKGDRWIYLPERPAVLIPGRALQLDFQDRWLSEFGYRAIILGQKL